MDDSSEKYREVAKYPKDIEDIINNIDDKKCLDTILEQSLSYGMPNIDKGNNLQLRFYDRILEIASNDSIKSIFDDFGLMTIMVEYENFKMDMLLDHLFSNLKKDMELGE
jgi:hypothetical protein